MRGETVPRILDRSDVAGRLARIFPGAVEAHDIRSATDGKGCVVRANAAHGASEVLHECDCGWRTAVLRAFREDLDRGIGQVVQVQRFPVSDDLSGVGKEGIERALNRSIGHRAGYL